MIPVVSDILVDMKQADSIHIHPISRPIQGTVSVPGSKSISNRALLLAALAEGESVITNGLDSDDTQAMRGVLDRLGVSVTIEGSEWRVAGCGGRWPHTTGDVYLGSAGTVARFIMGPLAFASTGHWHLTASEQLQKRPIMGVIDPLITLGASIQVSNSNAPYPIHIQAHPVNGGEVTMSGKTSSQFISGVLLGAPLAKSPVTLTISDHIVQEDYVAITTDLMRDFGVEVVSSKGQYYVEPQVYQPRSIVIEPDASTATYFMALAAVTGGQVRLQNVTRHTRQPDIGFLDICVKMGCVVTEEGSDIVVQGPRQLKGGFSQDMQPLSDATLTLAAMAPFADAPIEMTGVAHIRHHECDRLATVCQLLTQLGIQNEERPDGLMVFPGVPENGTIDPADDHRVAMAMAVLGVAGKGVTILTPTCVDKTCPVFYQLLSSLGIQCDHQ